MKKVFISGATGFIGRNLVDYLYSKGYDITVNIRSDNNGFFKKNIKTYRLNTNEIIKDITYFKGCKFDGIIHLAANYLKIHQPSDLPKMVQSNILLGTHLLECAVISGVTWFINTGSFFQNKNKSNYSPVNLYSSLKESYEQIAKYYYENNNIKFCTIKLSDTYGLNDSRNKLINLLINSLETNELVSINASPDQPLNLLHIDDVVNAFYLLIQEIEKNNVNNGDVYSLKAKSPISIFELISLIEKLSKSKLNIKWPENRREIFIAEPPNIKNINNWSSKVELSEGIKSLLNK